jgi:hypothetical protein
MVPRWLEPVNVCLGAGVGIAFIVTISVAAANGGFVDVDATGADNYTRAAIHYAADRVTEELSSLDVDVPEPARLGCRLAEVECPTKISGVAVASIVLGVLFVLQLLIGLFLRHRRREGYARRGKKKLYGYGDV